MTREAILRDTLTILKRVSVKPIEPTAASEVVGDLGLDSIQVLELIAELEDHFDINVPLNNLGHVKTVGQMVDHLLSIMGKT